MYGPSTQPHDHTPTHMRSRPQEVREVLSAMRTRVPASAADLPYPARWQRQASPFVIDVGANVGWFALNAAAAGGTVAAFEGASTRARAVSPAGPRTRLRLCCEHAHGLPPHYKTPSPHTHPAARSNGLQCGPRAIVVVRKPLAHAPRGAICNWARHKVGRARTCCCTAWGARGLCKRASPECVAGVPFRCAHKKACTNTTSGAQAAR